MPRNYQQKSGQAKSFKDDRFNSVLIPHPVIAIVKDNVDADKNGKIRVYLTDYGGEDPNDSNSWVTVSYMSPWFGATEPSASTSDSGTYLTNQHSYGFWATAPDIGTQVICVFVNGKPNQGYYIGCLPDSGAHFMVPAIGASNRVIPNEAEATTYGGADRLPTVELNTNNPKYADSSNQYNEPKPVHSYQAAILQNQGLIRDNIRDVIGSSSMRESPSSVFGISTPGAPIWDGGYTRANIKTMLNDSKTDSSKLKIVGRVGGHSLVMDDGELLSGRNQMLRLRSSGGHQITMSDDGQVLFITHSNGQSWVELGPEGTIDIFSTNSFNVRTQGDINLHADNNVNINAKKALNISAESLNVQTSMNTNIKVGGDCATDTAGKHTIKAGGTFSMNSAGAASLASDAETFVNGSKVNLNTGQGAKASSVPALKQIAHVETTFSKAKGWMNPAPSPSMSITSRLPTHMPFASAGKGVDVPVEPISSSGSSNPSPAVSSATASTATPPAATTNSATIATTPVVSQPTNSVLPSETVQAVTSQNAVQAAAMSPEEKAQAGVLPGAGGLTAKDAEAAGVIKPGAADIIQQNMAMGMPAELAAPQSMFTGKNGINNVTDLAAPDKQAMVASMNLNQAADGLKASGVITGNESPTQVAGVVNAANKFGVDTVTSELGKAGNTVKGTAIGAAIGAGTFAAQIADKLKSGLSGLATSLSDLGTKISSLLPSNPLDSIKGAAKSAFEKVESSFANLKGGQPNVLGGGDTPLAKQETPTEQALNSYESAKAQVAETEALVFAAKKSYRDDPSSDNLTKLQEAEQKYNSAQQKVAQASSSFLATSSAKSNDAQANAAKNLFGTNQESISSAVNSATSQSSDMAKTTLNSGVNALPGGLGSLTSISANIGSQTKTLISGLGNGVSSLAVTGVSAALAAKLPISVSDATKLVTAVKDKIPGLGVNLSSAAGSIASGSSGVAPATVATATMNTEQLTAKTGALLSDARIPLPNTKPDPAPTTQTPSQIDTGIAAKEEALNQLKIANTEYRLAATLFSEDNNNKQLEEKFLKAEQKVNAAIKAYNALA